MLSPYLLLDFSEWEAQIEEWQGPILADTSLPEWYITSASILFLSSVKLKTLIINRFQVSNNSLQRTILFQLRRNHLDR